MTETKLQNENLETYISAVDLDGPIPEQEPYRQYYFVKLARKLLKEREARAGRKMTFCIRTFGCQMNARDSEKLAGILSSIGYEESSQENADFVIFNTCTVRENADNKVYGHLGYLNGMKKKNPEMMIALCGCMMQEENVVARIRESYSFVDLVFGTFNIYKFAELITEAMQTDKMVVDIWDHAPQIVENLPNERKYSFKTGVNIMYGCNNFCSYCIVPYVRGRERSRRPEEILNEIQHFADDGVREVMLLGQNVNSYGRGLDQDITFAELLRRVTQIDGIDRIRFMTSHPKDLSDELIEVMASSDKICNHLHLPLQSGSTRILQKMNRHYTKEDYLNLVERIRKAIPDIALTTDIIVGFPGETDEDFEETMNVVSKVRFHSAFTFIYSKRTGTPAAEMDQQVPKQIVKERFNRLLQEVQKDGAERTAELTGQVKKVLFEEVNRQDTSMLTGRLSNNCIVHVKSDPSLIGQIRDVKLTTCKGFYFIGELV